jgi:zinc protease
MKPRVLLIDMPNAGQAAVFLACASIPRTAADYFSGKVANALLGGGYSSWLNQEVRVKRGLSYGAGSGIETHRTAGLFLASAQTKNESAAEVAQVMETQVTRLATETASPDYLRSRKAVLIGAFSRDLETNDGYVKRLGEIALYGLPLDTMEHTVEDIEAVDAESLRSFAEHHLPLSAMSVVIAGEAAQAAAPLRKVFPQLEIIPQNALDFDAGSLQKAARR